MTSTAAATTGGASAAEPALSQRLGPLVVGVRRDLAFQRQIVRGEPSYVVHDPVSFCNHAFTPLEYRILCSFRFTQSLAEVFEELVRSRLLQPEDDEEFYEFVLGLHGKGLLVVPGVPTEGVLRRHEERRQAGKRSPMKLLVSWRVPLGNPDVWLSRMLPYVSWLFGRAGLLLWTMLLVAAVWQCGDQLGGLYGGASNLLALENLPIIWCSLVVLKGLHELGHAFAIKRFGGVVPDFGVLFLFMTPCAYVDANSSWTLPSRWQRIVVALGGMYVETLIAFVFAIIWAGTPPGLLQDVAQNVVVLASITTLLININPLIKFDGYYVFSDLFGVFNLQERAMRYLRGVAEHRLLGLPKMDLVYSWTEQLLIWFYAPASFVYRLTLAFSISLLMMTAWPAVGAALGLAFAWMMIGVPIRNLVLYLWNGERTAGVRLRARCVMVGGLVAVVLLGTFLPVSSSIVAPGVLDPRIRLSMRAPADSFLEAVDVVDGQVVDVDAAVCTLRDPELESQLLSVEIDMEVARTLFDATEFVDPGVAATHASRLEYLSKRSAELLERKSDLSMTAPQLATVVQPGDAVLGQFLKQGEEFLQLHSQERFIRVVLTDYELIRARLEVGKLADVRLSSDPGRSIVASVHEIRRSASRSRVPVELTMAGGGDIYAVGTSGGVETDQPYLHVFLAVEDAAFEEVGNGTTARVRFGAGVETLGGWAKRRLLTFIYNWRMS